MKKTLTIILALASICVGDEALRARARWDKIVADKIVHPPHVKNPNWFGSNLDIDFSTNAVYSANTNGVYRLRDSVGRDWLLATTNWTVATNWQIVSYTYPFRRVGFGVGGTQHEVGALTSNLVVVIQWGDDPVSVIVQTLPAGKTERDVPQPTEIR